ncbi:DUF6503 family protein [Pedobacter arcticus]|uniref:DUF6503 family protein n=1 Tax=Pedobacter arcticus TaxID=752140 RepID=UPI000368F94B|nr:DUF6503 family protein [Pedobacter arcticus]
MQKKLSIVLVAITVFILNACSMGESADSIIKKSIAFYGMDKLNGKTVDFDFREKHFTIKLNKGEYFYESSFKDSLGLVKDQLSNHGFVREQNGLVVPLSQKDSIKYAESLNSVVYFALLPLKLKDKAVNAKFLRTVPIKGDDYHQVEVGFDDKNGGSHHDDIFYFWFDAKDSSMDYFAYSKGGNRFRAINGLINSNGIYLQNYTNLENKGDLKKDLKDYYTLFEQDKLTTLSQITFKNLSIK